MPVERRLRARGGRVAHRSAGCDRDREAARRAAAHRVDRRGREPRQRRDRARPVPRRPWWPSRPARSRSGRRAAGSCSTRSRASPSASRVGWVVRQARQADGRRAERDRRRPPDRLSRVPARRGPRRLRRSRRRYRRPLPRLVHAGVDERQTRLQGFAFWTILVFIVNAALFTLVGLQLPIVISTVSTPGPSPRSLSRRSRRARPSSSSALRLSLFAHQRSSAGRTGCRLPAPATPQYLVVGDARRRLPRRRARRSRSKRMRACRSPTAR